MLQNLVCGLTTSKGQRGQRVWWLISAWSDKVLLPCASLLLMSCKWQTCHSEGLNTVCLPENGTKEQHINIMFLWFVCLCIFSDRRGGSVSCHQARGAGHQGDSRVLWEAAAAAEGHQPCVEQPHGLHVACQARCKMLKKYKYSRAQDSYTVNIQQNMMKLLLLPSIITQICLNSLSAGTQPHMIIEHCGSIHNKRAANNIMKC